MTRHDMGGASTVTQARPVRADDVAVAAFRSDLGNLIGPPIDSAADQFAFAEMQADLRLLQGDPDAAWRTVRRAFDSHPAVQCPPRAWALLGLGARALRQSIAAAETASPHRAVVDRFRTIADGLPCRSPHDHAWRQSFRAATAMSAVRQSARRDEIQAWRRAGDPMRLAEALVAAACGSARPDHQTELLREARDITTGLGAATVVRVIDAMAETIGVELEPTEPVHETRGDATARSWGLTERECEVLEVLATGKTNREIASMLFISPKTASAHVSHILMKMGAATRSEATAKAFRHRAVSVGGARYPPRSAPPRGLLR